MNKSEVLEIKGLNYKLVRNQEEIIFPYYLYNDDVDDDINAAIEEDKKDISKNYLNKFLKEMYGDDYYPDCVPVIRELSSYGIFKPDNNANHTYMIVIHNIDDGTRVEWDENISERENRIIDAIFNHKIKKYDFKKALSYAFYADETFIGYEEFLNYIHSHLDKELTIVIDVSDHQDNGVHILEDVTITTYDEYTSINKNIEYPEIGDITYYILTEKDSNTAEHLYKLGYLNNEED